MALCRDVFIMLKFVYCTFLEQNTRKFDFLYCIGIIYVYVYIYTYIYFYHICISPLFHKV